jgi:hypothetical protein
MAAAPTPHEAFAVMRERVCAGLPIYFLGPLSGPTFERHVAAVAQLQRELGRPVRVVYASLPT